MGEIINSKTTKKGKTIYQIEITKNELLALKGEMKKVRLFLKKFCTKKEYIKERGNHNSTKYIAIPLEIRPRKRNYKKLTYQTIEFPKERFYIYGLLMK